MTYTTIFFDLDETLYFPGSGVWEAVSNKIYDYMRDTLGYPDENIVEQRKNLYETYGTTLKGLYIERGIDYKAYLEYVHDISHEKYLKPNPVLREKLKAIPLNRWVFTNSDITHTTGALNALGLEDCFVGLIEILEMFPACKPDPSVFMLAMKKAGAKSASECILVDDNEANLKTARDLGFYTIKPHSPNGSGIPHVTLNNINEIDLAIDALNLNHKRVI